MNARLLDLEWRSAWGDLPGGERPHWLDAPTTASHHEPGPAAAPGPRHEPPLGLRACGITVRAGGATLLTAVDLHLPAGEVGVLLGPNGAGKSTLLSVLAGLRRPDAGAVDLDGVPLAGLPPDDLACRRALLAQDTSVAFDFAARELVELGRHPHRFHPAPDEAGIVDTAMAWADVGHLTLRRVQGLSGGERARVQLARALAQVWQARPNGASRWLLLDEPTAALDLRHQHETLDTVRRWARGQGVGVLAVLHDLNLALRYADRVWVLHHGRLQASGAPARVLTPALLRHVWQVQAQPVLGADGCPQLLVGAATDRSNTPSGRTT